MELEAFRKRAWAEVDLDCAEYNFKLIQQQIKSDTKICCVIKANAYGLGAVELAREYARLGAGYFAVSNIEEALQLRQSGIVQPILILGYTDTHCASLLSANNISQCVFSREYGEQLSKEALAQNVEVKVHIKLDTGMGRIGFPCKVEESLPVDEIASVCRLPRLISEGIFTHFASADEGDDGEAYTLQQFKLFMKTVKLLEKQGVCFAIRHCANSAAIFDFPQTHLDMVRAGIVLYGLRPSQQIHWDGELKQVMTLHSIVDHIKEIEPGDYVSYGREYCADSKRRIATIPIGYADGLWRSNVSGGIVVKIGAEYAPIVGRICMDQCMADITGLKEVHVGSAVTVYGRDEKISIDSVADRNHTINYEIMCALGERIPRAYIRNHRIEKIVDNTLRF